MDSKKILKSLVLNIGYYLWIIFTFALVTFFFDYKVALFELIIAGALLIAFLKMRMVRKTTIDDYVKSLSRSPKGESKDTLANFPLPVVMLQLDGTILWCNPLFNNMLGQKHLTDVPITDFIPDFDISLFKNEDLAVSYDLEHNGRYYHIFGNITKAKHIPDDHLAVLYWDDRTGYEKIKQRYYMEKSVCASIVIDNFEDVMQDTPNADKPKLTATIEEILEKFGTENDAILQKYEKDRYIMCFQKQYLDKMIENNFSILNDIRNVNAGNKMAPTLSIGIGMGGDSLTKNESYSSSALDMALGRGGDQAIIKDDDQYYFYGGKTQEVEKRTRVKSRVIALAIRELISSSDSIIIMGHRNADIDVLGAAMGLHKAITNCGKDAKILLETYNETVQRVLNKLGSEYEGVFIKRGYANEMVEKNTLVFVVDTHKRSLVEEENLLNISEKIVLIDHHRRSADFIDTAVITYHEPYASSTSELVTEVIQYMDSNPNLSPLEAEALYAGIYMDTKNFTFKTGVRTFEAVSYLRRAGVDTAEIKKLFRMNYSRVIKKMAIIENAHMAVESFMVSMCEKSDDDMQTIVAQAADDMLNITNVKAAFVICDMDEFITISGRSFGDINVQVILEKLGGGGHLSIAGAQISGKTKEEVYDELISAINEYKANL